jgi:Tfp pilus assembly protein PilN
MIRINLLRSSRSMDARPVAPPYRAAWFGVASVLGAALIAGLATWSVSAETARLDREAGVLEDEIETMRLGAREAAELQTRKKELTEKLAARVQESAARSAPVRVLAAVGDSAPEDVLLTGIHLRGTQFEIEGRARSLEAVTEFAERIHVAGVLSAPVEIVSTSAETRERSTFVRFSLRLD